MPIAIQVRADNTFLDDVIVTRETKRANGCAELCQSFKNKQKVSEKNNHAFFSHVCSCRVFFFF